MKDAIYIIIPEFQDEILPRWPFLFCQACFPATLQTVRYQRPISHDGVQTPRRLQILFAQNFQGSSRSRLRYPSATPVRQYQYQSPTLRYGQKVRSDYRSRRRVHHTFVASPPLMLSSVCTTRFNREQIFTCALRNCAVLGRTSVGPVCVTRGSRTS